jgi:DNA-binding response OmpR family regulator
VPVIFVVLVVDDSAVARRALAKKLREAGFSVREVHSSADAVDADLDDVGCAILDLDLGDGNGVDVARAFAASSPSMPLAFFTAAGSSTLVERARALGPVFSKPDDVDAVVSWAATHVTR